MLQGTSFSQIHRFKKVAVFSGAGDLPQRVLEAIEKQHCVPFVIAMKGLTDPALCDSREHLWLKSIGQIGHGLRVLRKANVTHFVMAGAFKRPPWRTLSLDLKGAWWLIDFLRAPRGDDSLLRLFTKKMEKEGFIVQGPQEFLPSLIGERGALGRQSPPRWALENAKKGLAILDALGPFDVGQGLVIEDGWVLGIEAAEGTDALIHRCGLLKKMLQKGILVKTKKKQQDDRLDLPGIGPKTIDALIGAGLAGVIFRANDALIIDREAVKKKADTAGIFVYGL